MKSITEHYKLHSYRSDPDDYNYDDNDDYDYNGDYETILSLMKMTMT